MATFRHEVVYEDGRNRIKLLSPEEARALDEQSGIKSVKKLASHQDKSRRPDSNKGAE